MIDLRSDTVTLPSPLMKEAMMAAQVGDDVFGEDPTVNRLQEYVAELFQMEAALFCPSGTMCNQIAIAAQTDGLDEIIVDRLSHIYNYETAGHAHNSRVGIKLTSGNQGIIQLSDLKNTINADFDWLASTALLSIENTCNKGGGSYYSLDEMTVLSNFCKENDLKFHLDGARLFNALVETQAEPSQIGPLFDSISICFSKGLGAPIGSMLIGNDVFIKKARRFRKVMGGGMRQVGYLAAACQYAIKNNIERLSEDHRRAKILGGCLSQLDYVVDVQPIKTNIVIYQLDDAVSIEDYIEYLGKHDVVGIQFGPKDVRFVTHLDFNNDDLEQTIRCLESFNFQ